MKSSITKILLALLVIFTYTSCTKEKTKFIFYKDSDSGEISSVEEYNSKIEKQKIIFKDDYPSIFSDFDKMFRVV